ncbi:MAG: hypothetical protein AAFQ98_27295, partial [Bacteroidota bacterium]
GFPKRDRFSYGYLTPDESGAYNLSSLQRLLSVLCDLTKREAALAKRSIIRLSRVRPLSAL